MGKPNVDGELKMGRAAALPYQNKITGRAALPRRPNFPPVGYQEIK
jgi:hypothetical protein